MHSHTHRHRIRIPIRIPGQGHRQGDRAGRGGADMYGLASHPGEYERSVARVGRPLYERVTRDVAAAGLPEGALVLDVGTGPGIVPRLIATAAPGLRIEGVDQAAEMVAHAQRQAAAAGLDDRVRFRAGDVVALPYADASADLVVSSISLHHWADVAGGLRDVLRVLRPGAQAWIYDFRWVLGGAERTARGLAAGRAPALRVVVGLERPAPGMWRISPIGRLTLRRLM
jgi:SAM-dependent methyltransferase